MNYSSHVLITGSSGQLGTELLRLNWPAGILIDAPSRYILNLSDPNSIRNTLRSRPYSAVINCGAFTAVDRAEEDVQAAFLANALGPAILADETRLLGIPLVHVSTDYVFDGQARTAYTEADPTRPLSVYGASKLAGEVAVTTINSRSAVVRTAWVLSAHGSNFLKTMLKLAKEREIVSVVDDQRGCPTSATHLAQALMEISLSLIADLSSPTGIFHFVNSGSATWADLAEFIMNSNRERGLSYSTIRRISGSEYPALARRPQNSCLSTSKLQAGYGITPSPWETAVSEILGEIHKSDQEIAP